MQRLKNINVRTSFIIVLFSFLVSILCFVLFISFQESLQNAQSQELIYRLNSDEIYNSAIGRPIEQLDKDRIVEASDLYQNYLTNLIVKFLPLFAVFLFFLFGLSFFLWKMLVSSHNKDMMKIVDTLNDIENTQTIKIQDSSLQIAYQNLKEKFDSSLEDYKRLNSYLSHEQKNAIAILRSYFELSNEDVYIQSIDRITDGIDDILTISENKGIYHEEVDVVLLCASVVDTYRKKYDQIIFDFDEELTSLIYAKERWIYRAVANLLDNAIKYGNNKPIYIKVRENYDSVIVIIQDQGVGIPREKADKIFNNGYRIQQLNTDGYGIGLSLVSHVCDLCGGFVTFESSSGHGTTFYLSFPQIR